MDEQRTARTDPATWQALEDEANAVYLADTWAKKWADTEARRIALEMKAGVMGEALERIAAGVDHPLGVQGAPDFYDAVGWAQGIAREALAGWKL